MRRESLAFHQILRFYSPYSQNNDSSSYSSSNSSSFSKIRQQQQQKEHGIVLQSSRFENHQFKLNSTKSVCERTNNKLCSARDTQKSHQEPICTGEEYKYIIHKSNIRARLPCSLLGLPIQFSCMPKKPRGNRIKFSCCHHFLHATKAKATERKRIETFQ